MELSHTWINYEVTNADICIAVSTDTHFCFLSVIIQMLSQFERKSNISVGFWIAHRGKQIFSCKV
jgi:hypothetical protein